jgi:hypothetical protein
MSLEYDEKSPCLIVPVILLLIQDRQMLVNIWCVLADANSGIPMVYVDWSTTS